MSFFVFRISLATLNWLFTGHANTSFSIGLSLYIVAIISDHCVQKGWVEGVADNKCTPASPKCSSWHERRELISPDFNCIWHFQEEEWKISEYLSVASVKSTQPSSFLSLSSSLLAMASKGQPSMLPPGSSRNRTRS